jgi:large subunit ribosomal protein L21
MATFAIIETGGKQYRVSEGMMLTVEKLNAEAGKPFAFEKVLLVARDGAIECGTPYLPKQVVNASVLGPIRGERKMVFRFHSKTRYRKKKTHRQDLTKVQIGKI